MSKVTGTGGVLVAKRRTELSSLWSSCLIVASLAVASQKCQQSHLYNVCVSSRGSCGDAKVGSERRSWKDLSGMSRQKVLKGCHENKQESAPPCLHAFRYVAPIMFHIRGAFWGYVRTGHKSGRAALPFWATRKVVLADVM